MGGGHGWGEMNRDSRRLSASTRIASFAARFRDVPLSAGQRHLAFRAFLDTFAVAIASRDEAAPGIAGQYLARNAGCGKASAWTDGAALAPESAAWLNGIAAHVLDYDDVMMPMRGHVSAAMVPALIALSQVTDATGKLFSSAYIAGFEVMARISRVMAIEHYTKGWHSTSALGILGAVAACSVLLGLDERQITNALGLAVAQASGGRENFGTMAKSFQAGQCGAAAVRAVLLAQSGFDASENAIDGKYGYLALYGNNEDLSPALDALGTSPLEIDAIGIDVKKYPCCYGVHRALDGILRLREQHGLSLGAVGSVEVTTSARGLEALIHSRPTTGLAGKFSMEYAVAAALLDGYVGFESFADAMVMRPQIQAFLPSVKKSESTGAALPRWTEIKVRLKNGSTLGARVAQARGDAGDPLSDEELVRKVEDCFSRGRCGWSAGRFAERVFGMTDTRIDDLIRPLYAADTSHPIHAAT